jgi:hypothetical protein
MHHIILWSGRETYMLEFINHPKFPLEVEVFKKEYKTGSHCLAKMQQNRTVIVFTDETLCWRWTKQ